MAAQQDWNLWNLQNRSNIASLRYTVILLIQKQVELEAEVTAVHSVALFSLYTSFTIDITDSCIFWIFIIWV
jgi:hypothetical protein